MKEKMTEALESIAFSDLPRAEEVFAELSSNGIARHEKLVVEYCLGYVQEKQRPTINCNVRELFQRFEKINTRLFDYNGGHLEKTDFQTLGRLIAQIDNPALHKATGTNPFANVLREVNKTANNYKRQLHRRYVEYYCF